MIGWTNTATGGVNIQNGKAVIHVLTQVGSTINFLKDGITVILKPDKSFVDIVDNNLAHWYYSVNSSNYGTWTVTATLDFDTASATILVATNNEYDVSLFYGIQLFNNGDQCSAVTGGWADGPLAASTYTVVPVTISTAIGYSYSTSKEQSSVITKNKITLYNGDIIRVSCSFMGKFSIYILSSKSTDWYSYSVLAEYTSFTETQTVHELAITSNMQGYVLVGAFGQQAAPSGNGSITQALIVRA